MYLKTLQLRGFKSFASATTLEFEPGITCVVGPNGSGKSNVVDALSWVMGEQGVKSLRGGKMEDVIFAGTTTRAPLGRAEVSLTIDNSDGALDIEYTEVTLTRTLFRNGGSEYAINGAQCRLLDIQDLLSDTGLGREMHVIVGQGQLDAVLRATPAERRGFIEEAAGVLKHRKRKEKALRKLDSMQGNLLRLKDLLVELRRQLGPLSRQAKAAQRAHVLAAAVRDSGLRVLADDLVAATQELERYIQDTAQRRTELTASETELHSLEETLAHKEHAAAVASPHAAAAGQTLNQLQGQREQLRNLVTLATERLRHLGAASQDTHADLDQLRSNLSRATEAAAQAKTEVDKAKEIAGHTTDLRQEAEAQLRQTTSDLAAHDHQATKHRERVAQLSAKTGAHRSTVEALTQEIARLDSEHLEAKQRLAQAHQESPTDSPQSADLEARYQRARQELERRTGVLKDKQSVLRATEQQLARERSQLAAATARAQALELSLAHGHGDQAVLTELDEVAGQVLALLRVPAHLERALAAALGALGAAAVVPTQDAALAVLESAAAASLGAATVVHPVQPHLSPADTATAAQEVGGYPLHDHLSAPGSQQWLQATLMDLVRDVVVVPSVAAGRTLIDRAPWAIAVTEQGQVLSNGRVHLWAGSDDGPLRLHTELEEAQADIASHTRALAGLERAEQDITRDLAAAQDLVDRAQAAGETLRVEHQEAAQARHLAQGLLRRATQDEERAAAKITGAHERLKQANETLVQVAKELDQTTQIPVASPATREQLAHRVSEVESALAALRDQEMSQRVSLRGLQEQFASQTQRVGGAERTLKSQEQAAHRAQVANARREKMAGLASQVQARASHALTQIDQSVYQAQENLNQINTAAQERDQELSSLRARATQLHNTVRTHIDQVHKDELHQTALRQRVETLENKAIENYGMAPKDVMDHFGPHVPIELPRADSDVKTEATAQPTHVAYVRAKQLEIFEQSTRKLASLGKINPLALEEFTALEERHQFLSDQLEDLTTSRQDLLNLVSDIDHRVEQAFAQAYADTTAQFEKVFGRLFPGGQGKLILEDPDEPLTTGIEIEARPAGKQVKRLSLLSGGERSLTAIAFLVAIFLARPSPFYVMDEVEAALDDVNLGRLLSVFEELRQSSQLIVITHQKRTMQIADALYGVTMAGDGISTVISQRLELNPA